MMRLPLICSGNRNQEKLVQLFLEVDPHESFFDDGGPSTVDVEDESWDQIQRVKNVARSMCEAAKLIKVLQSLTSIKSDYFRMKYMQSERLHGQRQAGSLSPHEMLLLDLVQLLCWRVNLTRPFYPIEPRGIFCSRSLQTSSTRGASCTLAQWS